MIRRLGAAVGLPLRLPRETRAQALTLAPLPEYLPPEERCLLCVLLRALLAMITARFQAADTSRTDTQAAG